LVGWLGADWVLGRLGLIDGVGLELASIGINRPFNQNPKCCTAVRQTGPSQQMGSLLVGV
jgi:hypothetical protein